MGLTSEKRFKSFSFNRKLLDFEYIKSWPRVYNYHNFRTLISEVHKLQTINCINIGYNIEYRTYRVYPTEIFIRHLQIPSQFQYRVTDIVIDWTEKSFLRLIFFLGVIIFAIIIGNLIPKIKPYLNCNHNYMEIYSPHSDYIRIAWKETV